jgi:hypothetical protein
MTTEPVEQPAAETPAPAPQPETISLTTAQLDARIKRAQSSANSEFLSELGFKSKDELANVIKAQREAAEANQTETERERTRANEASAAATATTERLMAAERRNAVMEAALKAGIPGERIGAVTRLVDSSAVTYLDGAFTGADEAVAALVAENAWITAGVTPRPVGTGAGAGAAGNGSPATGLTADQQWAARVTGVSAERYAASAQSAPGDANREYIASSLEAQARAARGT